MVGSAIVRDLSRDGEFAVKAVDVSEANLAKLREDSGIESVRSDLREEGAVAFAVAEADLVVSAVPGFMGLETLRAVIEAGKNVVDISFFGEDPFLLDGLARSKGVTAVVDCGVAPGLSNVLAGRVCRLLDHVERYLCYVGGLPQVREWPFEYKTVFSPSDVLEEYLRPARLVEFGREVLRPALSEIELVTFPEVGTLEAFNTDGLRTLAKTMKIPFMKEKTLRYPGHAELIRVFRESGFLDSAPVDVDGQRVRPIALTSKLLFERWRLKEGEVDVTVMQVIADGKRSGRDVRYSYFLLDRYDAATHTTAMARTTGYTCSIVARQIARGLFGEVGICPPEFLGRSERCYAHLLEEYAKRNIALKETIEGDVAGR
jgi:saccharopine dehydrogenase-like NADP-dependent oxidoreductase